MLMRNWRKCNCWKDSKLVQLWWKARQRLAWWCVPAVLAWWCVPAVLAGGRQIEVPQVPSQFCLRKQNNNNMEVP